MQIMIRDSFQKYEENFILGSLIGTAGETVKLEAIRGPSIKMLYIDGDKTCPISKQREFFHRIPAIKSQSTIYDRTHNFVVGDNDEQFVGLLLSNLEDYDDSNGECFQDSSQLQLLASAELGQSQESSSAQDEGKVTMAFSARDETVPTYLLFLLAVACLTLFCLLVRIAVVNMWEACDDDYHRVSA